MIKTHGFKFSMRQNYPHTHTTRSKQPRLQHPQIRKDNPRSQRHSYNVILLKSMNRSPYYLIIVIIILTFNYLLPETFYIGILLHIFMLKNNIIFINFIIQNRISLLFSHQHYSSPLLFLLTTPLPVQGTLQFLFVFKSLLIYV